MRQMHSRDVSRVESRDESRTPAETRAERERAGRDETPLERETQSERENTSNESQMLELMRRALLYRKSATAAVVCTWRVISTSTPTDAVASSRNGRRNI